MTVTIQDINKAQQRIAPYIDHTAVLTCSTLDAITEATLFFKCENFQKTGTFKFRGACNAVFALSDEVAKRGVATHSSGNHGQALAYAAKTRGIPAYIVMPKNSAQVKREAVANYGANITFSEPGIAAREASLHKVIAETGATFIHPYDNEFIIAGQGTVVLEFMKDLDSDLDYVITPLGGGGLLAGTSIVVAELAKNTKTIGAEPLLANDGFLSFQQKKLVTTENQHSICDGLLVPFGKITSPIVFKNVAKVFTADETTILKATQYIWERMKIVVEPSAAITLAIILENPEFFAGKKIGLILSGGNVDIKVISSLW